MRVMGAVTAAVILVGCAHTVSGTPTTSRDVTMVASSSGLRDSAPDPSLHIEGTDNGRIDTLAATSLEDINEFWAVTNLPRGGGYATTPSRYVSYDSRSRSDATLLCGQLTYGMVNAGYCASSDLMMWDRGTLLPSLRRVGGDMGVVFVLAHEMGHHVQNEIGDSRSLPSLVAENQADCYAGAYLGWVAEGNSDRFTLDEDGMGQVLRTVNLAGDSPNVDGEPAPDHGASVERAWSVQRGYYKGVDSCATITSRTVGENRAGMPTYLTRYEAATSGNVDFTDSFVELMAEGVNAVLPVANTVTVGNVDCRKSESPVAWCPAEGTVFAPADNLTRHVYDMQSGDVSGRIGDGTSIGGLINALSQEWLSEKGATPNGTQAGYRSACVVGSVVRLMADPSNQDKVTFSAGDSDEILTDLLYDGFTAMDANGKVAPGIADRTRAYLTGLFDVRSPADCLVTYP